MAKGNLMNTARELVEESGEILEKATRARRDSDAMFDELRRMEAAITQRKEEAAAQKRREEQMRVQSTHSRAFTMLDDEEKAQMEEDEAIESKMLTRAIENAQKQIEGKNFGIRKYVLQYDDVMNKQREVIYSQRQKVLKGEDISDNIYEMMADVLSNIVDAHTTDERFNDNWNYKRIDDEIFETFDFHADIDKSHADKEKLKQDIYSQITEEYKKKEEEFSSEELRQLERLVLLRVVDSNWMDHIDNMDQLKQGINLRAYGQVDPVQAYTKEGFAMFEEMNDIIKEDTVKYLFHMERVEEIENEAPREMYTNEDKSEQSNKPVRRTKIGRNDPCPCGSGKKYKKCHGRNANAVG